MELSDEEKTAFENLLKEYVHVFAWSYANIPGLDTDIVMHEVHIKPKCKLLKQKLHKLIP